MSDSAHGEVILIEDVFLPIFVTVSSSFSMENRLLAHFIWCEISKISDFEMTSGEKLAEQMVMYQYWVGTG